MNLTLARGRAFAAIGPGLLALLSAQAQWHLLQPTTQPAAVGTPSLSWDGNRQAVLLFGGDLDSSYRDETWTWDGANWTLLQPATHPSGRSAAGMVYDSARHRVVLFGGHDTSAAPNLADTWEWDGTDWLQRLPNHAPSGRGFVHIAYDIARGRTVLFGGGLGGVLMPTFDDTWEWDGIDWTQRFPAHAPAAARAGSMVYDSLRNRCVRFGGLTTAYVKLNDTWEWDGIDWTQRFPAHAPTPRYAAGMAYDSLRGRTVLFGGGIDPGPVDDTWEYDGQDWQLQTTAVAPSPRDYLALAFDPLRARTVLRGSRIADTWEYEGVGGTLLGTYAGFGQGCAGQFGVPVLAVADGRPILGTTLTLSVTSLPPDHFTTLVLGFSDTAWLGGALPYDLGALGMTSCTLYVSSDAVSFLLNWGGTAYWQVAIPNSPQLLGVQFFNQAATIDRVNPLGMIVSNAGAARIGDF